MICEINTEIEISRIDSGVSSDQSLLINFIKALFEELKEFIH
ncbi:hypothetical protein [Bacteroides fragilis]|nr:hypothetical protein [Bacteroides fragilis]